MIEIEHISQRLAKLKAMSHKEMEAALAYISGLAPDVFEAAHLVVTAQQELAPKPTENVTQMPQRAPYPGPPNPPSANPNPTGKV